MFLFSFLHWNLHVEPTVGVFKFLFCSFVFLSCFFFLQKIHWCWLSVVGFINIDQQQHQRLLSQVGAIIAWLGKCEDFSLNLLLTNNFRFPLLSKVLGRNFPPTSLHLHLRFNTQIQRIYFDRSFFMRFKSLEEIIYASKNSGTFLRIRLCLISSRTCGIMWIESKNSRALEANKCFLISRETRKRIIKEEILENKNHHFIF